MSILGKIKEIVDFGQNFQKDWLWSTFSKISIFVKIWQNADFCQNIGNVDFSQKYQKDFNFGQNFNNFRFW